MRLGELSSRPTLTDLVPHVVHDHRLAATLEAAAIGIVETDEKGRILGANTKACELVAATAETFLGQSVFDITHPDDVRADRAQFQRQVAGEIDSYSLDKRFRRPDGTYGWVSVTSSSVRGADGRFLYAVRIQRDITARKKAEELLAQRVEEQAALYALSERLQRAAAEDDVYDAAMAAIFRALGCQRASILMYDTAGIMRFVCSRGLSRVYQAAVEGHSPWSPETRDAEPICIKNIETADLSAALKDTVRAEGIAALAFIPIQENGRLLGKFMVYYDAPHVFVRPEIDIALTIARQVAFTLERNRAEHAAQRLAAIVESSHDAIVSKNLDGIIMSWNSGAERLFGYTAAEAVGRPVTMLMPPDRVDEEPGILARIRRGERVDHYETVRRRKDGSTFDVSLTVSPVRDRSGAIVGASKIARDISYRKRAEAQLRESEHRLQQLLSAIPAAIYTTDAQGRITYYNEAAVKMAGRTPVIGTDEWCVTWKLYWPDGTPLPHDQCPMAIALKEGRAIRGVEAVAERPDGIRVPFIPYPTPLRDATGKIVGAINMLVDISERKEAETQQRVLLHELNHRVKNNMQMLQSMLFAAAREAKSEEAKAVLGEASGRLASMAAAQRVLYGVTGATRYSAEEFLHAVCGTAQQTFCADVTIDYDAEAIELPNDTAMPLALILNELLTNAVKHARDGSGRVAIRVGLRGTGNAFELYVEDGGPGFDLTSVQSRCSGLRVVQGLARQLGGRLVVTKDPASRCSVEFDQGGNL